MSRLELAFFHVVVLAVSSAVALGCMTPSWFKEDEPDAGASGGGLRDEDPVHGDPSLYLFEVDDIYAPGVNAHLSLGARRADFPDASYDSFNATARFYEVSRAPDESTYKRVDDEVSGINDCGFQVVSEAPLSSRADMDWWTAGEVTLSSDAGTWALAEFTGDTVYYDARLKDLGVSPAYGETYTFRATGGEAPSMSVAVDLPRDLLFTMVGRNDVSSLPTGDLTLEWTGGDDRGVVKIIISAASYREAEGGYIVDPPYHEVICLADDDGRFTVPGDMLARIPTGLAWEMSVRRANLLLIDAPEGNTVFAAAAVTHVKMLGLDWSR